MKIVYISPENTVGTLGLWKKIHESRGNQCTTITLYKTKYHDNGDYCLQLPLIKSNKLYMWCRHTYYKLFVSPKGDYKELKGYPPTWKYNNFFERLYFKFRDWLWKRKVNSIIEKLNLLKFDVFHLEWGLEFYRDARFVKKIQKLQKPIICTYHGQDLRTRGVIKKINDISSLNLTSELDLLQKHPNINYLFLPFDTSKHKPKFTLNNPIKICHSPTNRYYKGSDDIIKICSSLKKYRSFEFILIENMSNKDALEIKNSCDILIDQIHNRGGWGYGMNSVEALSMGLCCLTELIPEYQKFISDHPFVNINIDNLEEKILNLLDNPKNIINQKKISRDWVVKYHDINNVSSKLYEYYESIGVK